MFDSLRAISRAIPVAILSMGALGVGLFGLGAVRAAQVQGGADDDSIRRYWPIDAPPRQWALFPARPGPTSDQATLTISNQTTGEGKFIIWYSNPERAATGTTNGEEYRYCEAMGRGWIFFDEYLSGKGAGDWSKKPVKSSRILLAIDHQKPVDLMTDGTYAACGSTGQPYLFVSSSIQQYHLQVWGYLSNNPKYKWYWDALVSKPTPVTNGCLHPPQTAKALKVQEAWWSNFAQLNGNANSTGWSAGSTGTLGPDGLPDGARVTDFRTVWHAEGQIPYYSTGTPDGATVRNCITSMPAGVD